MARWSIAQNPLLLPWDQPCNVLGNFYKRLTYCQQKNLSASPPGYMCISQGYTGMLWRSLAMWKHLFVVLLVPLAGHAGAVDCTDASGAPSDNSAPCKIHDIVPLCGSSFYVCDWVGDGNRMTLGASSCLISRQPLFDHYLPDAFYPTLLTIV